MMERIWCGANSPFLKKKKTEKNKISDFKFKKIKISKIEKSEKSSFYHIRVRAYVCACVRAKNCIIFRCRCCRMS